MKKTVLTIGLATLLALGATSASANTGALGAAAGHYAAVPASCLACHADGNGQKNTITAAWLAAGGTSMSAPTNWVTFDTADSDGDGTSNKAEIEAGSVAYSTATTATGSDGDGGGGCVAASVTTPSMMVLAMLSLGFFVRRKKK